MSEAVWQPMTTEVRSYDYDEPLLYSRAGVVEHLRQRCSTNQDVVGVEVSYLKLLLNLEEITV